MSHKHTPPVEGSGYCLAVCMWVFYQGREVEDKSPASLFVTFIRVTICLYLMPESPDSLRHSSSPRLLSYSYIFSPQRIIKQPLGKTLDRHPVAIRNIKRRRGTSGGQERVELTSQQLTRKITPEPIKWYHAQHDCWLWRRLPQKACASPRAPFSIRPGTMLREGCWQSQKRGRCN